MSRQCTQKAVKMKTKESVVWEKYVLKRFGSMLITLFLIATVTFFLMHLIPGDPFSLPRDTPEVVRENLEEKYGLDKPLFEQYTIYMKNLLHGDFGSSMKI